MQVRRKTLLHNPLLPACLTFSCLFSCVLNAALISPDSLTVSVPSGSNNSTAADVGSSGNPYTDDVLLDSITFDGVTLSVGSGQIAAIQSAYVVSGRDDTNAEWGDDDDGSDGNTNPFSRVGINPFSSGNNVDLSVQESTDPAIQDIALASAFSSLSLSEITDGEGNTSVTNFIFNFGVTDNDAALDLLPEIVLFERGNNDSTTVRAITGGTFDSPILAPDAVTINSGNMWDTGLFIDTTEINSGQELAAIGIDLNDFGISDGTIVYGLQIETDGGDFGGFFQAAEDPDQFSDDVPEGLKNPLGTVPEPSAFALLLGITAAFLCTKRRKTNATP